MPTVSSTVLFVALFFSLATLLYSNYELSQQTPRRFRASGQSTASSDGGDADLENAEESSKDSSAASPSPSFQWSHATRLLTFGDSLSDAGFDPTKEQPSPSFPFGNPDFPKGGRFLGPTWADFLTIQHNESLILGYNLAKGGATVDNAVVPSYYGSPSFYDQVNRYKKYYHPSFQNGSWDPTATLVAIRFGVNDIVGPYNRQEKFNLTGNIARYTAQLERLYDFGARNFVMLGVGPIDRNYMQYQGDFFMLPAMMADIKNWNLALVQARAEFASRHPDAFAALFDIHAFFEWLAEHAAEVPATRELKNTTGICPAYAGANVHPFVPEGKASWYMDEPECGAPLVNYFWANQFHVTFPVHNATAAAIVNDCLGEQGAKRFCVA